MSSQELVPLSHDRNAYNNLHRTALPEHNDHLTAEQAEQISQNFDIEVYLGTHGKGNHGRSAEEEPMSLDDALGLPTQQEYDAAKEVIDNMQPGDTLFSEGPGFQTPAEEPLIPPEMFEPVGTAEHALDHDSLMSNQIIIAARGIAKSSADNLRRDLERRRGNYEISAFQYARELALLKGVRVVYADIDAFEGQSMVELGQGSENLRQLGLKPKEGEKTLSSEMHRRREHGAPNILKDWALEHLPPEGDPQPAGRKPKLVMLFGLEHRDGLEEAFHNLGLPAEVTELKTTSTKGRANEQLVGTMQKLMAGIAPIIFQAVEEHAFSQPWIDLPTAKAIGKAGVMSEMKTTVSAGGNHADRPEHEAQKFQLKR